MHAGNGGGSQLESGKERGIEDWKEKNYKADVFFSKREDGNPKSVSEPIKSEKVCIIQEQQQKNSHCEQKREDKSEKSGYGQNNGYGERKEWEEENQLCEDKSNQEP